MRWLSTSIPEAQWQSSLARTFSAEYNVNNLVSPVLFQEALCHVPEHAVVLEIAPHALLQVRPARGWGGAGLAGSRRGGGLGAPGQGPREAEGPSSGACQGHQALRDLWGRMGSNRSEAPTPLCPTQAVLKRGLKPSCTIVPLMKKDHRDNLEFFLSNVGRLHLMGWVCRPCWALWWGDPRFPWADLHHTSLRQQGQGGM